MDKLSEVQIQIKEVLEEFERLKNVDTHLAETEAQLTNAYSALQTLEKVLDKELKDIEKLEKISVKSLFYKTLGNKEEQIDKERQDYLEASLKFNEYKKEVELLEFERDVLRKKAGDLPAIKKKLDNLKEVRAEEILNSDNTRVRNEFRLLMDKLDTCILLNQELDEAIDEGEKSVKLLSVIIGHLKKAGKWGYWDMSSSKSRGGDYMKHQAIDKALKYLPKAQHQLNLFSRELKDLGESNINFKLNMAQFNRFTDFFFDNLISDWIIQQRIKSTLNNMESTSAHVKRILLNLKQEKQQNDQNYTALEAEKNDILLS